LWRDASIRAVGYLTTPINRQEESLNVGNKVSDAHFALLPAAISAMSSSLPH
jgi:hypothetical protein